MELDEIFKALLAIGYVVYLLYGQYSKHKRSRQAQRAQGRAAPPPELPATELTEVAEPTSLPDLARQSGSEGSLGPEELFVDPYAEVRLELTERLAGLQSDAQSLAGSARLQRATAEFAVTLEQHVVAPAKDLQQELSEISVVPDTDHFELINQLELVQGQLEVFIGQRRDADSRARLGDADTMALACYRPVMEFARAEGLLLNSAKPVTQFGGYELAIWTGFIPTGLAPIFLPPRFFDDLLWWPALAHEIGHDFLAATRGLDQGLRAQLGLPDERRGRALLPIARGRSLTAEHLWGLFGGWFEELFCDVFGTLMLGPSYVQTMVRLFANPQQPEAVAVVALDGARRYDLHPPRHLRVLACVHLLERMSYDGEAARLLHEWWEVHGELPASFFFPHGRAHAALPAEPLIALAHELVDQLYDEQFTALAGYRLRSVPGVDFGPSLAAQAQRAAAALAAGQLPDTNQTRAVVAGAVMALCEQPQGAASYLALARQAILAEGTFEHAPLRNLDSRSISDGDESDLDGLRQAFILHTILAPPPAVRRAGRQRRSGLLSRPRYP